MVLRAATDSDWEALTGFAAPTSWWGYAEARGAHFVEGMGAIYLSTDGRWWAWFARCPGVRGKVKLQHQTARRLLAEARERGIVVHAMAHPEIEGADRWMARLGFVETDEIKGGHRVWTLA